MFNNILKNLDRDSLLLLFKETLIQAERKGITVSEIERAKPDAYRIWGDYMSLDTFWQVFSRFTDPDHHIGTTQAVEIMNNAQEDLANDPEAWFQIIDIHIRTFLEEQSLRTCFNCDTIIDNQSGRIYCSDCFSEFRR